MLRLKRKRGASVRPKQVPGQWKVVWFSKLRWFGVAFVLVGLTVGFYVAGQRLLDPNRFPIRQVVIEGALYNVARKDVRPVLEKYLGQNFFALDITAVQEDLLNNAWIKWAAVQRQWPDKLTVRLAEREVFGRWGQDELVDVNGIRFSPPVVRHPKSWPLLIGPDDHEMQLIHTYQRASAVLNKLDLQLVQIAQNARRSWRLMLDNGMEIQLGRAQMIERLKRFAAIYPHVLADHINKIAVVDLRYSNGFAVRWTPASDTAQLLEAILSGRKPPVAAAPFKKGAKSNAPDRFESGMSSPTYLYTLTGDSAG
jgi:cell division protein FtsQ